MFRTPDLKTFAPLPLALAMMACSATTDEATAQPAAGDTAASLPRTMSVSGVGEATAAPDMATINFAVETQEKTAGEALAGNARKMNAVIDLLRKRGIEARDLQTSGLNLHAVYKRNSNGRYTNEIEAYQVTNSLTIRVRDIDEVGETIDAVVGAGANRMNSLYFSFADDTGLKEKARKAAIQAAKAKAKLYADEAGVSLGKIITISETGASPVPYATANMMVRAESASFDAPTPVAAGEGSVTARISIVYELK